MTNGPAEPYPTEPRSVGRYVVHRELAVGGMARVSLGTLRSGADFSRVVAIKELFPQYACDPEFVAMFLDEARVAARVRHPNVVGMLDVVTEGRELFLVMEYIAGEALSRLLATAAERYEPPEPAITSRIMIDLLEGLHAAHTATAATGSPLHIVHRDVSPQNLLVGVDGVSRVVDFGVAKAMGRSRNTDDGQVKGKVVYMAPEQMGKEVDLRADLWAAGAVLWEMLAGRRLFVSMTDALGYHTNNVPLERPSVVGRRETPLDDVAMRALSRDPAERYQTAREMIVAIERAVPPAPARRVSVWTQRLAEEALAKRSALVAEVEAYQPASLAATVAADVVGPPRARSVVPLVAAVLGALAFAAALGVLVLRPGGRGPAKADNGPPSVASAASVSLPGSVALPASATAPPSGAMTAAAPSGSPAGSPSPSSSSPSAEASSGVTAGALRARKVRGHGAASAARTTESDPAPPVIAVPSLPAVDAGDPRELNRRK